MDALVCFCWVRSVVCHRLALSYKHASGWVRRWLHIRISTNCCVWVFVYPSALFCHSVWLCLTGGSLFSETQNRLPMIYERKKWRGCTRSENIHQHAQTHNNLSQCYGWDTHKPHVINNVYHITDASVKVHCCMYQSNELKSLQDTCVPAEWSVAHARSNIGIYAPNFQNNYLFILLNYVLMCKVTELRLLPFEI